METVADAVGALQLFGDPTRLRLAALLARHELTVTEITAVTGLGQSRVSTHLAKLKEAGVLRDRREGLSTRYGLAAGDVPGAVGALWGVLRERLGDEAIADDLRRCAEVLRGGREWPDAVAGRMERHYSPGRTWEALARAFLGLADLGDVLDMGSGDGTVAELVAPRARSVLCVDRSARIAEAAHARLRGRPNVRVAVGDVEHVPAADATFDQVLLFNVLPCCTRPSRAVSEAGRVLRPGGRVVAVTVAPHRSIEHAASYGHRHAGVAPERLRRWLVRGGLRVEACDVTSRERRDPPYDVVTAFASKAARPEKGRAR
jgi:SAM-dependent methyltransferase